MLTIKNRTNSPYQIRLADGTTDMLPARGELTADVCPQHLPLYRALGYFEIVEVVDPLDHDGDGKKGGSTAHEPSDDLTKLRQEYQEAVGKRPFMGWDAAELQKRIDAALEA